MKELALTLPGGENIPEGFKTPLSLERIFQTGLQLLFIGAILLSFFFIIWAGIQWVTSGGDKEGIAKARMRLTYAIVGLVISLLALFTVNVIGGIVGVELFK